MTVFISRALADEIVSAAAASPGSEVCGLLLGDSDRVEAILPARNVATEPTRHFEVDPAVQFAAIRAARAGSPAVIGHYHSHPSGLVEPSSTDAAMIGREGELWLIVAGNELAAWRAHSGGFVRVTLVHERNVGQSDSNTP